MVAVQTIQRREKKTVKKVTVSVLLDSTVHNDVISWLYCLDYIYEYSDLNCIINT